MADLPSQTEDRHGQSDNGGNSYQTSYTNRRIRRIRRHKHLEFSWKTRIRIRNIVGLSVRCVKDAPRLSPPPLRMILKISALVPLVKIPLPLNLSDAMRWTVREQGRPQVASLQGLSARVPTVDAPGHP